MPVSDAISQNSPSPSGRTGTRIDEDGTAIGVNLIALTRLLSRAFFRARTAKQGRRGVDPGLAQAGSGAALVFPPLPHSQAQNRAKGNRLEMGSENLVSSRATSAHVDDLVQAVGALDDTLHDLRKRWIFLYGGSCFQSSPGNL